MPCVCDYGERNFATDTADPRYTRTLAGFILILKWILIVYFYKQNTRIIKCFQCRRMNEKKN